MYYHFTVPARISIRFCRVKKSRVSNLVTVIDQLSVIRCLINSVLTWIDIASFNGFYAYTYFTQFLNFELTSIRSKPPVLYQIRTQSFKYKSSNFIINYCLVCRATCLQPLPKPILQTVLSSACNSQYFLFTLRSCISSLRLLPRPPAILFPSAKCFRRKFLRKDVSKPVSRPSFSCMQDVLLLPDPK